ncbi:hypothetical protein ACLB1T_17505 [Escherichia coli]
MLKQASGLLSRKAKPNPLCDSQAIERLGTMQGGYNIHPLIDALDDAKLAPIAAKALSHTLLDVHNFYDVEEKSQKQATNMRSRLCSPGAC